MKTPTQLYFEACDRLDAVWKSGNSKRIKLHQHAVEVRKADAHRSLYERERSADDTISQLFAAFAKDAKAVAR